MKNVLTLKGVNISIKLLLAFLFVLNVGATLYVPIMAVYATTHIVGATLAFVGTAGAVYSVIKTIVQLPTAKWLDKQAGERWDFRLLLGAGIGGIIYTFFLIFVDTQMEYYIFCILAGFVDGFMMAAFYAIFSHHIDKESQGFEWTLFSILGITIATAVGGFFGGRIADAYGFKMVFMVAGVLNVVGSVLVVSLHKYMKIMRKDEDYKVISDTN